MISSIVTLTLSLTMFVAMYSDMPLTIRLVILLMFICICPGLVIAEIISVGSMSERVMITNALSISTAIILSLLMVHVYRLEASLLFGIIGAISVALALIPLWRALCAGRHPLRLGLGD